jgi:OmpA-OmpF porin, OOP family
MRVVLEKPGILFLAATLALPMSASLSAQQQEPYNPSIIVNAPTKGPEIKGIISARDADRLQVTTADGTNTIIAINDGTRIKGGGIGNRSKPTAASLLNGLPVSVKTLQSDGTLIARQISFRSKDLKTATMIRDATAQRFEEQTAATEALRGRMGDIDKYNVKGTTNVYFDTGKAKLSEQAKAELCSTASSADATDNALMLVVGYTDSVGSEEYNQRLSEKRAAAVINHLQQACHWKPYRMLVPTGMAEADPAADNSTEEGKAQNRRVAVNVLVSKSVDGMQAARGGTQPQRFGARMR